MNTITTAQDTQIEKPLERIIVNMNNNTIVINGKTFELLKDDYDVIKTIIDEKLVAIDNYVSHNIDVYTKIKEEEVL